MTEWVILGVERSEIDENIRPRLLLAILRSSSPLRNKGKEP